ncbi:hypothetical protein CTKZ_06010 [Cellulomonas algicola]|uniref:Uncharacterized protein n=1 Tax=Cellulomonas algicola TaxID=2071633 RepID=A0A401UWH9_9CELL|nr:AAA family ATPase [Cellulomonas algicola]GCD19039.1 hypothetical protein CTKZ_06010 [Cellulomonas algicola]
MILWLNGTHGVGKTTTAALVQRLLPDARVLDAEKVGETLMDVAPGLPATDTSSTGTRGARSSWTPPGACWSTRAGRS